MIFKDDPELHSDKGVELYQVYHGISVILDFERNSDFKDSEDNIQRPVYIGAIKNHELLFLANERMQKRFAEKNIYTRNVYYSLNRCDGTGQCKTIGYGPFLYNIEWHYDSDCVRSRLDIIKHLKRLVKVQFASPRVIITNYYPDHPFNHFYVQIDNPKQRREMKYVIRELLESMDIKIHTKENPSYPEGIVIRKIEFMNCKKYIAQCPIVSIKK